MKIKRSNSTCIGEATFGILHPVLVTMIGKRCQAPRKSAEKSHKDDKGVGG